MKYLLITLITLFLTACSSSNLGFKKDSILDNNPNELAISHQNGDIKWLGCHGFVPFLPGVPDNIQWNYNDKNIYWITGTSDDLSGNEHALYNTNAIKFAEKYNLKKIQLNK